MADCDLFKLIEPTANPSCCNDARVDCNESQLTGLDLSNRQLEDLPPALLGFHQLQELSLENNRLSSIQIPLLFASPTIKTLNLAGNPEITELPVELAANLQGLESIDLSGTGITDVSSLAGIPSLKEVTVSDPAALVSARNLPGVTIRSSAGGVCADSEGLCSAECTEGQETTGSCLNSGSPAPPSDEITSGSKSADNSNQTLIIGSVLAAVFALILLGLLIFFWRRRQARKQNDNESLYGPVINSTPSKDSSSSLRNMAKMSSKISSKRSTSSGEFTSNAPTFVTPAPIFKYAAVPSSSPETSATEKLTAILTTTRVYIPDFAKGSILKSGIINSRFLRASQRHLPAVDDASSDEILLSAGDLVLVEKRFNDGWCLGWNHRTGKRGMFPHNALADKPPSSPAVGQAVERPGVPGLLNGIPGGRVVTGKAVHGLHDHDARMLPDPSFSLKQGDVVGVEHVYEDCMAFGYNYTTSQRGFFPLMLLHLYHEDPIHTVSFDHSFKELGYPSILYEASLSELASASMIAGVMKEFDERNSLGDGIVVFVNEADESDELLVKRVDSVSSRKEKE